MLSASPIVEQLIANPMSRLRGEFRILGVELACLFRRRYSADRAYSDLPR